MPSTYAYFRRPLDPPRPDPDAHLYGARARLGVADPAARSDPEAHLTRALAALGITPAAIFSDNADGLTVPLLQRPGVALLLARLAPGDTLVTSVWSFAGARDLRRSLLDLHAKDATLLLLDPAGRPLPGGAESSALLLRALDAAICLDGALRGLATGEGMRRRKAEGRRHCAYPPYGMRWHQGRPVADENELAVIERIIEMRRAGLSCYRIAAALLRDRIQTRYGREYSPDRVRRILVSRQALTAARKSSG